MKHYADSSFLVSCYIADHNTSRARNWLSRMAVPLPFTELHALEVRNAFQLGIFRGLLSPAQVTNAMTDLRADLRHGRLTRMPVDWPVALRMAATLSGRHSAAIGARSLDILHVAAAKALRATELVTFDSRQHLLAVAAGFSAAP